MAGVLEHVVAYPRVVEEIQVSFAVAIGNSMLSPPTDCDSVKLQVKDPPILPW